MKSDKDFSEFKDELALFIVDLRLRITEISNRIGYVNSKDVADGGSGTNLFLEHIKDFKGMHLIMEMDMQIRYILMQIF